MLALLVFIIILIIYAHSAFRAIFRVLLICAFDMACPMSRLDGHDYDPWRSVWVRVLAQDPQLLREALRALRAMPPLERETEACPW